MSLVSKFAIPLPSMYLLGLCTGMLLGPWIPKIVTNCLIPVKDLLFSCREFFTHRWGDCTFSKSKDTIAGARASSSLSHGRLDVHQSVPGHQRLREVGNTGDESPSFYFHSDYDNGYNMLESNFSSPLSLPLPTHEIENVDRFPSSAEIVQNIFGEGLSLSLNRLVISGVRHKLVKHTLDKLMASGDFTDHLWTLRLGHQRLSDTLKATISAALFSIFVSISDHLGMRCERGFSKMSFPWPANPSSGPTVLSCYNSNSVVCVVNIKSQYLFSKEPITNDDLYHGNIAEIMMELHMCMVTACSRFGILCDGYFFIFVEFVGDSPHYYNYINSVRRQGSLKYPLHGERPPFKTAILNVNSINPSFLEGLTFFLYRAKKKGGVWFPQPYQFHDYPTSVNSSPIRYGNNFGR